MECQQTFHAQRRCWLQRVFSAFHYSCCTLGTLDSIGCVVSFCCLLQERVDNIRSHLRAGAVVQTEQQSNLEGDVVLVAEDEKGLAESDKILQHAGEGADRMILHKVFLAAQNLTRSNRR